MRYKKYFLGKNNFLSVAVVRLNVKRLYDFLPKQNYSFELRIVRRCILFESIVRRSRRVAAALGHFRQIKNASR